VQDAECPLLGAQAKESWELDTKEKLAAAAAKKDAGNDKFKAGKTALAIKKYKVRHGSGYLLTLAEGQDSGLWPAC